MKTVCLSAVLGILALGGQAGAATWRVPGDCSTIVAGIDSAAYGDTVLVASGTYEEMDIVLHSGVCLRSETGEADGATIDAGGWGQVFRAAGVDGSTEIVGFTITGGYATEGGALYCSGSSLRVRNVLFAYNTGSPGGAVFLGSHARPTFTNCTFYGNGCVSGMPVYCDGGVLYAIEGAAPIFDGCLFSANRADHWATVICEDATPVFTCCNIYGNWEGMPAGAHPSDWDDAFADQLGIRGNLCEEPVFCNPPGGNFGLGPSSPCLPENNACGRRIGAFGVACSEETSATVRPTTWSAVKALYR
ncbi:MAG: hypothetical protein KAW17_12175 [Candidatus Eisenbacteria sp.]|nr:hypothetical protein [Candidatus Eisenbacteria bacterium]